jgi:hypothetical protein
MNKDIKVIVATHKKYEMPKDEMYLPLHVGKKGKDEIGFKGDDTGENISNKNPYYCELTGLYWAWKNLKADYLGLVHYRRHLSLKRKSKNKFDNILTLEQANKLLKEVDVILPNKRKCYIENLYDHYKHIKHMGTCSLF